MVADDKSNVLLYFAALIFVITRQLRIGHDSRMIIKSVDSISTDGQDVTYTYYITKTKKYLENGTLARLLTFTIMF